MSARLAASLAAFAFSGIALAQVYPSRPIKLIVPYPPGGGTDTVARLVGQKMQESTGQPIVVENKPGASELIGMTALAQSPGDGYTIGMTGNTLTINPLMFRKLPYDSDRDFTPVARLVNVPLVLVTHPSVPATTVKELVQLAKSQPGKLNYAHIGTGTPHALAMELFKMLTGTEMIAVTYKGVAPASAAVVAGEVQMMLTGLSTGMPQVKAGKLKAIAVTPAKRVPAAPEVPSIAEAGYPEFDVTAWYGIIAPSATPADVVAKLSSELGKAVNAPDLRPRFAEMGLFPASTTPAELGQLVRGEVQLWTRIIKAAGIKPE
jgi:tripartite-type tricarboxylate transporter receptor subunit TctC